MKRPPEHIAIVISGSTRWAELRDEPPIAGQRAGIKAARKILRAAQRCGVRHLSILADGDERALLESALSSILMSPASSTLQPHTELHICPLVGRQDLVQVARTLAAQVQEGSLRPEDLDLHKVRQLLTSVALPDPDLIIRCAASNEATPKSQLSDCLVFESAYAELYFANALWPDFSAAMLRQAVSDFEQRERRFGRTSEQLIDLTASEPAKEAHPEKEPPQKAQTKSPSRPPAKPAESAALSGSGAFPSLFPM